MRRFISTALIVILITLSLPAKTYAATDGCPDTWILKFEPNQEFLKRRGAGGVYDFPNFFSETTGTLEKYKKTLGNNIAIGYKSEFSKDKTNWVPFKWPMKLPNDASAYHGRIFYFLHPGFTRGVYTIETKDCKSPGIFYTDSLKSYEIKVNQDGFKIEDAVPKNTNFKDANLLAEKIKDELKLELSNYQKTGSIAENYPNDEAVVFMVPQSASCMDYINWKWNSKGKSCNMYIYFQTPIFENSDSTNNYLTGFNYNIIEEITLPSVINKSFITCIKGKTTKKVSGTNPKCPKGYKKAS